MDLVTAIKTLALKAVLEDTDSSYHSRYLLRWYSKTFHTSIEEASKIPIEDVMCDFYEEMYENMKEEEREEARIELTKDEEQVKEAIAQNDMDDVEAFDMGKEEDAKQATALKNNKKKIKEVGRQLTQLGRNLSKQSDIYAGAPLPPDITMDFAMPDDDVESDGLGLMDSVNKG